MGQAAEVVTRLSLNNSQYMKALQESRAKWAAFGATCVTVGRQMMTAATVAAVPVAFAVREASKLEETMNKFDVVFGKNAKVVKEWADGYGAAIGRSRQQMAEFMAGTQDLLVPMGFAAGAATDLSKKVTMLAIDLASFNNTSDGDALRDLHAALTGSGEVMKKYGVIVSEAAVQQRLMQMAIDPKSANEQQKALARMNIILDGTKAAQGDAARSAGSFANQLKDAQSAVQDAAAAIGGVLLPIVTPLVSSIAAAIRELGKWAESNSSLVVAVTKGIAVIGGMGASILAIGLAAKGAAFAIGGVGTAIKALAIGKTIFASLSGAVTIYNMAITAATGRTVALKMALTALQLNPVMLTVTALATVAIGAGIAMSYMADKAEKAAEQQRKLAAENAKAANDKRMALDDEQSADQARMERLRALSKEESLSGAKKIEAANLIAILSNRYGELGASMDEATGKLTLQSNAFQRANDLMKQRKLESIEDQLKAETRQYELAIKQFNSRTDWAGDKKTQFEYMSTGEWEVYRKNSTDAEEIAMLNKILDAKDRLGALANERSDVVNNVTPAAATPATDMSKVMEAEKYLKDAEKEAAKRRRTQFEQELFELGELRKERQKNLTVMEDYAKAQLKAAEAARDEAEQTGDFDKQKTAEIQIAVAQEELDRVGGKRKAIDADYDVGMTKARTDEKKKLTAQEREWQQTQKDVTDGRAKEQEGRGLDRMQQLNPGGYMQWIQAALEEARRAEARANAAAGKALADANMDGVLTDEENIAIGDSRREAAKSTSKVDEYQRRLDAARDNLANSPVSQMSGSFYSNVLANMNGGTAADKTAQNTKDTVAKLGELLNFFQFGGIKGGLKFGR